VVDGPALLEERVSPFIDKYLFTKSIGKFTFFLSDEFFFVPGEISDSVSEEMIQIESLAT